MRAHSMVFVALALAGCRGHAPSWKPLSFSLAREGSADRLVLISERELRFHPDGDGRACVDEVVHTAIRAGRPDVLERYVDVIFDRTFLQRPAIRARIAFPDGSAIAVPDRTWDVPAFDRDTLYHDQRRLILPVPAVPPGAALDVVTEQRVVELGPLMFPHHFGGSDPVGLSRLTVTVPHGWEIEWQATALGKPIPLEPVVTEEPGKRRYVWEQSKIAAYDHEPAGVDPRHEVPRVTVRLKSWDENGEARRAPATTRELSAWIWEKTHHLSAPDDAVRTTVAKVLSGSGKDPREKARRLYEHAVENVRYCAIEIGYGGWFPHPASEVEKKRYGDCKDKSNYLKALLAVAGIKSRSVALFAHSGWPAPVGMPALAGNFNHQALLVELPEGPLLVDPTSRTVPFGELPPQDREAWVMPIDEGGAELLQAPPSLPEEHRENQVFTLDLDDAGDVHGQFSLEAHGIPAALLRGRLVAATPARRGRTVAGWLRLEQLSVTDVTALDGMELGPTLTASGRLEAPRVMVRSTGAGVVRLASFAPRWLPVVSDGGRRTPLVLSMFHSTRSATVKMRPSKGFGLKRTPERVALNNAWFDYLLEFRNDGGLLVAERRLVLKRRIVPVDDLAEFREAVARVHRAENAPVLFAEMEK